MTLWNRWKAAMRSFLHCVEESYRRSVTPYIDYRKVYYDADDRDADPGSTSTQTKEESWNAN